MRMKMVEARARRAQRDGEDLRRLARDLGRAAPRVQVDTLRGFRAALASDEPSDPYARGYRAALADLAAALEVEITHEQEVGAAERIGRQTRHALVLKALSAGPRTPSGLAEELRIDRSHLSHVLTDLRAHDLVAAFEGPEGDGRVRPQQLTLRGQRIVDKMGGHITDEVRATMTMIPRVLELYAATRRFDQRDLTRLATDAYEGSRIDVPAAAAALFDAIGRASCVTVDEDSIRARPDVGGEVRLELELAMADNAEPAFLRELRQAHRLVDELLLVRVDTQRDVWRRLLAQTPGLKGRPLEVAELATGQPPPDAPFVILYESAELRRADLHRFRRLIGEYESRAKRCFQITAAGSLESTDLAASPPRPPKSRVSTMPLPPEASP